MSDTIPRAEVERVLEELRARAVHHERACHSGTNVYKADAFHSAANKLAALLKPKQYPVEDQEAVAIRHPSGAVETYVAKAGGVWKGQIVGRRIIPVPPLEHGEGIEP